MQAQDGGRSARARERESAAEAGARVDGYTDKQTRTQAQCQLRNEGRCRSLGERVYAMDLQERERGRVREDMADHYVTSQQASEAAFRRKSCVHQDARHLHALSSRSVGERGRQAGVSVCSKTQSDCMQKMLPERSERKRGMKDEARESSGSRSRGDAREEQEASLASKQCRQRVAAAAGEEAQSSGRERESQQQEKKREAGAKEAQQQE